MGCVVSAVCVICTLKCAKKVKSSVGGSHAAFVKDNTWLSLSLHLVAYLAPFRVVSAQSRFGPGLFRPGSFRPWVVTVNFGGSFWPDFF